jgi:hypothetical protein
LRSAYQHQFTRLGLGAGLQTVEVHAASLDSHVSFLT